MTCVSRKLLFALLLFSAPSWGQNLEDFEKRVTEFTLDNGLHFVVVERHEAPVVSFVTWADVGGVNAVTGQTGIPHLFEHMAFKGTQTVGTKDFEREQEAMRKEDGAYAAYAAERSRGSRADSVRLGELRAAFESARQEARSWVESNEFSEIIEREGAVGINAGTGMDQTYYFYSLPSNKLELWFSLESDRFLRTVLREFYVERDVVMEERRMSESNPMRRLIEELLTTAFKAHPYGYPNLGHMSDLQHITREQAQVFFDTYYVASNLTIAIVGDVEPGRVRELANTYFGRLPKKDRPVPVHTVEPPQIGERRVIIEEQSQPILLMGYHKGSITHPDNSVFTVIDDILSRGRTSRLYRRLVEDEKSAIQASTINGYPADKYPNLMLLYSYPAQGFTAEQNEVSILDELERLKRDLVSPEELAKAKTRSRADLVRQLGSNSGLARQLAAYQVLTGDWRDLFRELDAIDAVTAEDVSRVAQETFTPKNRTIALIRTAAVAPATAATE